MHYFKLKKSTNNSKNMGKKKSVTFDVPSSPPHKPKKEKNIDSEIEARQKRKYIEQNHF